MRRVLSISLLIALLMPSLAPSLYALNADPEANLPACCRSHGSHHCVMVHWMLQHADSGAPRLTSPPCPFYPAMAVLPQVAVFVLVDVPELSAEPVHASALPAMTARRAQLLLARTRGDRGPPTDFA